MFAFIQVYIITVNDIIANEAAFVAMHSAAVTRNQEINIIIKKGIGERIIILHFFILPQFLEQAVLIFCFLFFLTNQPVEKYFKKSNQITMRKTIQKRFLRVAIIQIQKINPCATIWKGKKTARDYSGKA
ncbi:hypothetical protein AGMMS49573_07100 [Endomicrobiia bacterium]|nr:hypothetical protein AGMMS49573_07100 [Endomicrobiia bacterium]